MYHKLTAEDIKKELGLPKNYKVDAFAIYGGGDAKRYKRKFLSALGDLNYKIEKLPNSFIREILSRRVKNKRIWFIN